MKVLCLVLLFSTPIAGQPWLFYNVENLFDTIHDRNFHDLEFTPAGSKKYGSITYRLCIRQTSRVLHMLQKSHYHAPIVALCEVENRSVLDDLIRHQGMRVHGPWNIVHFDSPDYRGIDCAVHYDPASIREALNTFDICLEIDEEDLFRVIDEERMKPNLNEACNIRTLVRIVQ